MEGCTRGRRGRINTYTSQHMVETPTLTYSDENSLQTELLIHPNLPEFQRIADIPLTQDQLDTARRVASTINRSRGKEMTSGLIGISVTENPGEEICLVTLDMLGKTEKETQALANIYKELFVLVSSLKKWGEMGNNKQILEEESLNAASKIKYLILLSAYAKNNIVSANYLQTNYAELGSSLVQSATREVWEENRLSHQAGINVNSYQDERTLRSDCLSLGHHFFNTLFPDVQITKSTSAYALYRNLGTNLGEIYYNSAQEALKSQGDYAIINATAIYEKGILGLKIQDNGRGFPQTIIDAFNTNKDLITRGEEPENFKTNSTKIDSNGIALSQFAHHVIRGLKGDMTISNTEDGRAEIVIKCALNEKFVNPRLKDKDINVTESSIVVQHKNFLT